MEVCSSIVPSCNLVVHLKWAKAIKLDPKMLYVSSMHVYMLYMYMCMHVCIWLYM